MAKNLDSAAVERAISWFRAHRPALESRLQQGTWTIGEVIYLSAKPLVVIDGYINHYENGRLSECLAGAYILRPLRRLYRGLSQLRVSERS